MGGAGPGRSLCTHSHPHTCTPRVALMPGEARLSGDSGLGLNISKGAPCLPQEPSPSGGGLAGGTFVLSVPTPGPWCAHCLLSWTSSSRGPQAQHPRIPTPGCAHPPTRPRLAFCRSEWRVCPEKRGQWSLSGLSWGCRQSSLLRSSSAPSSLPPTPV